MGGGEAWWVTRFFCSFFSSSFFAGADNSDGPFSSFPFFRGGKVPRGLAFFFSTVFGAACRDGYDFFP